MEQTYKYILAGIVVVIVIALIIFMVSKSSTEKMSSASEDPESVELKQMADNSEVMRHMESEKGKLLLPEIVPVSGSLANTSLNADLVSSSNILEQEQTVDSTMYTVKPQLLSTDDIALQFDKQFPKPPTELDFKSFVTPKTAGGVNTTYGSRRNGNQQLRKEPYIPKMDNVIWNNSDKYQNDLINVKQ